MTSNTAAAEQPQTSTYETAPARLAELTGIPISTRQLRSWVWAGKVDHLKVGNRVLFADAQLLALAETLTVRAKR